MSFNQHLNSGNKPWWKSKWAIAAHIAIAYFGTSYYIHLLVKEEQRKRDKTTTTTTPPPPAAQQTPTHTATIEKPLEEQIRESIKHLDENSAGYKFGELARVYDEKIKWDERVMGLTMFRKRLLSHAKGDILEVGVGTGRNLSYYPSTRTVKSLTFVDASREMLETTREKYEKMKSSKFVEYKSVVESWFGVNMKTPACIETRFVHGDACQLKFPDNSFDTVVDTFGLCSVGVHLGPHCNHNNTQQQQQQKNNPVQFLNELARVCKPNGRVLLLEHGVGTYPWINKTLESSQVQHFERWGCWWNRDIESLIKKSDLEIEYINRWHFGTTYYIIARPKPTTTMQ